MFVVIGLMLTGVLIGWVTRKHCLKFLQQIIPVFIWLLLFLLGVEVGDNDAILRGLHTIGIEALVLTLGGTLGSVLAASLLWNILTGWKKTTETVHESSVASGNILHALKGSLVIVAFFVIGVCCGLWGWLPGHWGSKISFYALCLLMFSVGISVGNDSQTLKSFRSLNPRLMFLPLMTILGTLAGTAVVSIFLSHRSLTDCLAVGSGFGYYSLSSIFITEYRGGDSSFVGQYQQRNIDIIGCSIISPLVWALGFYFCRWSYNNGYDASCDFADSRTGVCCCIDLSRFCCRFQRSFFSNLFLQYIGNPD